MTVGGLTLQVSAHIQQDGVQTCADKSPTLRTGDLILDLQTKLIP